MVTEPAPYKEEQAAGDSSKEETIIELEPTGKVMVTEPDDANFTPLGSRSTNITAKQDWLPVVCLAMIGGHDSS